LPIKTCGEGEMVTGFIFIPVNIFPLKANLLFDYTSISKAKPEK
jgi:hypothetical protein